MIKSLLCFSSVAFLISVASAGSITLKANTTTPAIGEKVDIQIELPSDYKWIVTYWVEYYNGNIWRTLLNSSLEGAQDFYEGSLLFLGDEGKRSYARFVAFPKELLYRLYARDRNNNETYLEFMVQGKASSLPTPSTPSTTTTGSSVTPNTGSNETGHMNTTLTQEAAVYQANLDAKKDALLTSLKTTLSKIQNVYDTRVKNLVDTSMFKAVECLGFLSARAVDVDVPTIHKNHTQAILEAYVEISATIKRFSVGLSTDTKALGNAISNFETTFLTRILAIESEYDSVYARLKSDFDMYYDQNQALVYGLAEKIQKVDTIKTTYAQLLQSQANLYAALDAKSSVRSALTTPTRSVLNLLKGDIDDMIRRYQVLHPEISYELMVDKRDVLVGELEQEASMFINKLFSKDFDTDLYLATVAQTEAFLAQYYYHGYQCGMILSAVINRERTYLDVMRDLTVLIEGIESAESKVKTWGTEQVKSIEAVMLTLFQEYYTKSFAQQKLKFSRYVMGLISEAYYANHSQLPEQWTPEVSVSWTPYTFTKTYTRGAYALELTYLQQFLKAQGLYDGEFNGRYDTKTIEAIYKYQLQEGVVTGQESNKSAYGWMGPATRAAINKKMNP